MQQQVMAPKLRITATRRCASPASWSMPTSVVEVRNPYTGELVGTVPAARAGACARGLPRSRKPIKPKLTRYERQKILLKTAEILREAPRRDSRTLITAESGLCWKDCIYEVGRAYDVYSFAGQLAIRDDGEIYSCDITPQRQAAQDLHHARAAAGRASRRSRRSIIR